MGHPDFVPRNIRTGKKKMSDPRLIEIWQRAIALSNKYNGKEGRYLNEAIQAGGLDFFGFL